MEGPIRQPDLPGRPRLDPYLTVGGHTRGVGGMLGEGLPVEDEGLALAGLDDTFALKLAHCLRRSEDHTSELQSRQYLVCRLLLEKKKKVKHNNHQII